MAINKNFVVKNGLEVDNNLLVANADTNRVGIATTNPQYTLHVNGGIGATESIILGVSTVNDLVINGRITAGSSLGILGQYLVSTGVGVTWSELPNLRTVDTQTAGVGQTVFNTIYTVGLIDVYINGVKLPEGEFIADNAATVVLDDACFGGETVEFVAYSSTGVGVGFTGIQGLTILEEGSPVGSALKVTSINFSGASIAAAGSGIGVTVFVNDFWTSTAAGIHTTSNVGIGTTNPRFKLEVGAVGASGTSLYVNGDARITGILSIGQGTIVLNGINDTIGIGTRTFLDSNGNLNNLGIVTASKFVGDGSELTNLPSGGGVFSQWVTTEAGIHTTSNVGIGTTNPTSELTVSGNALITGITTVNNNLVVNENTLYVNSTNNYVGIGTTNPTSELTVSGNALITGITTVNNNLVVNENTLYVNSTNNYVGIGTTNPRFKLEVGAIGASGTSLYVNGDARITGILTVGSSSITLNGSTNTINVGSGVTIDGSIGNINVTGIISATTFVGSASGLTNSLSIVGSATTIALGSTTSVFSVTGVSTISTINTAGHNGRIVTLIFADELTVTKGSNLKLADDYITSADSTLSLYCDGTSWFEVSRSVVKPQVFF